MSPEEPGERDRRYYVRLAEERQRLLAKLLHAMAKALDFKVEQLEIFEGGYTPQGWADIEVEQNVIRRFAAQLAGRPTPLTDRRVGLHERGAGGECRAEAIPN